MCIEENDPCSAEVVPWNVHQQHFATTTIFINFNLKKTSSPKKLLVKMT